MRMIPLVALGLIVAAAHSIPARAVEWMSGTELIGHCQDYLEHPTGLDGVACASYVQGFLGGAEATDATVASSVSSLYRDRSSLLSRAADTRVKQRLERFGPTSYAGYCLARTVPNTEVVIRVIDFIASHPESADLTAQDVVYGALKEFFPCT